MQVKLTIQEKLKDERVNRHMTLAQLEEATGISRSTLGKYESDDCTDISPFNLQKLADYYGISMDYLLGRIENKNHPNTALYELHLSDDAIEVLKSGKFNHRLLSELICHKDFRHFMLDAEVYVDRIADMRIQDMNTVLETVRQMILNKHGEAADDLYLHTLKAAQVKEEEYFGHLVATDLHDILKDIREAHMPDPLTADEDLSAASVQKRLSDVMSFEGSSDEKKARAFLTTMGIDYDAISREQFVTLIEILKKSKHMKNHISQRGKAATKSYRKKNRRHK